MDISQITVEVRDKTLARVGIIRPEELSLSAAPLLNNVGDWTLTLPGEHRLAPALATPGAGIIVHGPADVLFSGPVVTELAEEKTDDPIGTITFTGVEDTVVLADMLAFPQPANADPSTQTTSHDVRTGPAETVMHGFVNANCGPGAPVARRKAGLIMGTNGGRGPTITKAARFAVLGTVLEEVARAAGLGFRVVQRGNNLVFETWQVIDRSPFIRLSVLNGNLASQKVAVTAPGVTRVVIGGDGEQQARTFMQGDNADSRAAEAEWGRRIERFVDQRQTDDINVYVQKIAEELSKDGFTGMNVQVVPADDTSMQYGTDWGMGDKVACVYSTFERTSLVTGLILRVDSAGFRFGVVLGSRAEFDESASSAGRLTDAEKRIAALETAA